MTEPELHPGALKSVHRRGAKIVLVFEAATIVIAEAAARAIGYLLQG